MITINDIANEFGITENTARVYLSNSYHNFKKAIDIKEYAKRMGYEPKVKNRKFNNKNCVCCGQTFVPTSGTQKYCHDCGIKIHKEQVSGKDKRMRIKARAKKYWYNGNYHTKAEETARMEQLREDGFSNAEIAKKIGRTPITVRRSIGSQPEELTTANRIMGQKIKAQKNAIRKQYVINKPIIEYNKALEEKKIAEEKLEAILNDISIKEENARKNARRKVKAPSIDLTTTQIAG